MKIAIILVACMIAIVAGETCTGNSNLNSECSHLNCDGGWHLACVNTQCTCVENTAHTCTSKAECDAVTSWDCPNRRRHCVDGTCRCTRF
ncbi:serine protease inhibitor Cvsi-2-like [Mytilus trossulus]|uniref:serine protease inhibitor Cvsi-2-like n=1 Tax=Mytilus trossulus TaxID=6551 RepID=UPI003004BB9F